MIAGAMNALGTDDGDLDGSYVWAGQCVGLFDQVESAGEVVARMAAEAAAGWPACAASLTAPEARMTSDPALLPATPWPASSPAARSRRWRRWRPSSPASPG